MAAASKDIGNAPAHEVFESSCFLTDPENCRNWSDHGNHWLPANRSFLFPDILTSSKYLGSAPAALQSPTSTWTQLKAWICRGNTEAKQTKHHMTTSSTWSLFLYFPKASVDKPPRPFGYLSCPIPKEYRSSVDVLEPDTPIIRQLGAQKPTVVVENRSWCAHQPEFGGPRTRAWITLE